ncbi:hypothetical protein [Mycolicibacterium fortuitum]|uniref:hypothetical protein n=1 Tax=Mycolicibacterium fortuitum TaxID=1766 RepID=UPI00148F62CE|nr:hypothetical protein [Mycolicibacterium fortuitum]
MTATTLRDLLQEVVDKRQAKRLPASSRAIQELVEAEEAAAPRGLQLNRTTVSQILSGTYKGVASDGTIRAIGWLAGVSDEVAFTAAGRRAPGPPFALELPPGIDDLSPRERAAAIEILRALIAQRQEINRYVDSADGDSAATSGASGKENKDEEDRSPDQSEDAAARLRRHQDAFRNKVHGDDDRANQGG